jgi:hypothetical protein
MDNIERQLGLYDGLPVRRTRRRLEVRRTMSAASIFRNHERRPVHQLVRRTSSPSPTAKDVGSVNLYDGLPVRRQPQMTLIPTTCTTDFQSVAPADGLEVRRTMSAASIY